MNAEHLQAFAWLRWRLLVNQWRRGGSLNAVLMIVVFIAAWCTAIPLLVGTFLLGVYLIPRAQPLYLLLAGDALVVGFLFFWSVGLLTELQRAESLSLTKFLHLPVSASGAFLLNYLSSLLRLSLVFFVPSMLGFGLALVYVKGPSFLPVVPSVVAFFLMITALTYQFQGWLGALMTNPRQRRTVIVAATMVFVLITQLPNLINFLAPWGGQHRADRARQMLEEMKKLDDAERSGQLNIHEKVRRGKEILDRFQNDRNQAYRKTLHDLERTARLANLVLPVGWLPLGVLDAAEGRIMPSVLGLLGMTLIGSGSLWRAFRATVRQYQGESSNRKKRPALTEPAASLAPISRRLLLEARLPGLSEPVCAIALATFRSLLRAPEAKMMLLTPVIMTPIFGSMIWRQHQAIPELARPLVPAGGMVFVLMGVVQMMGNLFGFDRDGFRVFVLSAASRRDILLGKNLAFAPVVLGLAAVLLAIVQAVCPLRLDHLLSLIPQFVSMFLLSCIITNLMSIYTPGFMAVGSLRPSNPKITTVLVQLVMVMIVFPLTQALTFLPLLAEVVLGFLNFAVNVPVCLLLSLLECAVVVLVYHIALDLQGNDLRAREQRILDIVTSRAP
ncbi:MAG: hypothetical protein ACP5XB_07380 [Isosphaeraceae bacterium]